MGYAHVAVTVILVALTVVIMICYATKGRVRKTVEKTETKLVSYVGVYVETKLDPLEERVEKTEKDIAKLKVRMARLSQKIAKTLNLAVTHGRKINDLAEMIFRAAYGAEWDTVGRAAWNDYVVNPTQKRWDEMAAKLTPEQITKILEIDKLQERIAELEAEKAATAKAK